MFFLTQWPCGEMAVKFQIGLSDKMKLQQMAAGIDDANA